MKSQAHSVQKKSFVDANAWEPAGFTGSSRVQMKKAGVSGDALINHLNHQNAVQMMKGSKGKKDKKGAGAAAKPTLSASTIEILESSGKLDVWEAWGLKDQICNELGVKNTSHKPHKGNDASPKSLQRIVSDILSGWRGFEPHSSILSEAATAAGLEV